MSMQIEACRPRFSRRLDAVNQCETAGCYDSTGDGLRKEVQSEPCCARTLKLAQSHSRGPEQLTRPALQAAIAHVLPPQGHS